jgi:hypothetical protein
MWTIKNQEMGQPTKNKKWITKMSGPPSDGEIKRQKNKVHLLPRTCQGETPNQ